MREGTSPRRVIRRIAERTIGERGAASLARTYSRTSSGLQYYASPVGRRSLRALTELRNSHRGERCVIIGNGPSLNQTNLGLLKNEYTFGLNRIYLNFESMGFTTSSLVVVNKYVVEQCSDDFLKLPGRLFSTWPNRRFLAIRNDAVFLRKLLGATFSPDARRGIWEGATVTYVALQLAYHMGFDKVILVGVDHRFQTTGPAHKLVTSEGDDPNHFVGSYFGKGFRWQLPDLETSEVAYRLARDAFARDKREIVDATVGGALTVFPKADLASCLT